MARHDRRIRIDRPTSRSTLDSAIDGSLDNKVLIECHDDSSLVCAVKRGIPRSGNWLRNPTSEGVHVRRVLLSIAVGLAVSTGCASQRSLTSPSSAAPVVVASAPVDSSVHSTDGANSDSSAPSSDVTKVEAKIDGLGFHVTSDQKHCIATKVVGDPVLGPQIKTDSHPTHAQLATIFGFFFDCGFGAPDLADLFVKQFASSGSYSDTQLACVRDGYAGLSKEEVLVLISQRDSAAAQQIGVTIVVKCNLTASATT